MRRAAVACIAGALILALTRGAAAEDPLLGTIEVRAPRLDDEAHDSSANATVVPITTQPSEGQTLADVLDDTVGVQVRRFGGLGAFSTISIRGSTPGQVGFFLDGIPLSHARSETVDLADLPLDELDRVEVYRGSSPLALPSSALAGVVNLVTREPRDTPAFSILAGGGSFGTRKASLSGSAKSGRWSGLVSATYLGSQGNFSFFDDNGTPLNAFDDTTTRRKNNAFDSAEMLAKVRYSAAAGTTLTGVEEVFLNDQGVPGIGAFQSDDASLRELRSLTYLRLDSHDLGRPGIDGSTIGYFVFDREAFRDVAGQIGVGNVATDNRTYSSGLDNRVATHVGTHEIEARLDAGGEVFQPRDDLAVDSVGPDQTRVRFDVALGDTWGLLDDRLLLQPSLRYEHVHDDFGGTVGAGGILSPQGHGADRDLVTPRLGLRFECLPGLALRANAGRYARAPNFSELFGNRGSVIGNPDLKPEKGINADLGFVFVRDALGSLTHLRAEATGFMSEVDDLIVLVQNSQRTAVPRNVARARVVGSELSLALRILDHIHLALNYTYQNARDHSGIPARDGNRLPGRPAHAFYARAEYHLGPGQLFYEIDLLASNFLDQANFHEVKDRTVHTIGIASRLPWAPLNVTVEVRNVSDNQVEDVGGYPLPGRSVFGSVRWSWEKTPQPQGGA